MFFWTVDGILSQQYPFPSSSNNDLTWKPSSCPSLMSPQFNPLNPELNPICYLLALLAHHFLHVSRIMVKSLTLRLLMSYIYGAHILVVSRSHTTTQHSPYDSSGRVIRSSQRPLPDNTRNRQTSMPPVGFEPTISAGYVME